MVKQWLIDVGDVFTDSLPFSGGQRASFWKLILLASGVAAVLTLLFILLATNVVITTQAGIIGLTTGQMLLASTFLSSASASFVTYRVFDLERDPLNHLTQAARIPRPTLVARFVMSAVMGIFFSILVIVCFPSIINIVIQNSQMVNTEQRPLLALLLIIYAAALAIIPGSFAALFNRMGWLLLLSFTFFTGIALAIHIVRDLGWREDSISFLGADANSKTVFSLTLTYIGLGLMSFSQDLIFDLNVLLLNQRLSEPKLGRMGLLLVLSGIGVLGVASFPILNHSAVSALHLMSAVLILLPVVYLMTTLSICIAEVSEPENRITYYHWFYRFSLGVAIFCGLIVAAYGIFGVLLKQALFVETEIALGVAVGFWLIVLQFVTHRMVKRLAA